MKLRVYNMINFRSPLDYYEVKDVDDAKTTIENLANSQLKNSAITNNVFGLEIFNEEENEWIEWEDENGFCMDDYDLVDNKAVYKSYV